MTGVEKKSATLLTTPCMSRRTEPLMTSMRSERKKRPLIVGGGGVEAEVDEWTAAGMDGPFNPAAIGGAAGFEGCIGGGEFVGHGPGDPNGGSDDEGDDEEEMLATVDSRPECAGGGRRGGGQENRHGGGRDDGADVGFDDDVNAEADASQHEEEELLEICSIEHAAPLLRNETGKVPYCT